MLGNKNKFCSSLVFLLSLVLLSPQSQAILINANWTGLGDGASYSDANNWDTPVVPLNEGDSSYHVTIEQSRVIYDELNDREISSIYMGSNSELDLDYNYNLTVLGATSLFGLIDATGGDFYATGPGAGLTSGRVWASEGSQVVISDSNNPTNYSSTGLVRSQSGGRFTFTTDLFKATDVGTLLDLSSIQSIDANFAKQSDDINRHEITAASGATLDLSGLTRVVGPQALGDWLRFNVNGAASQLRLDALQTTSAGANAGAGDNAGVVRFDIAAGASLDLPALRSVDSTEFRLDEGSTLTAGALVAIDDSLLEIKNGSTVTTGALTTLTDAQLFVSGGSSLKTLGLRAGDAGSATVNLNGTGDLLRVAGDVDLGSVISVQAGKDATIEISGNYSFAQTDETLVSLDQAVVIANGNGALQTFEVGGLNDLNAQQSNNGNFSFGELVVGTQDLATNLVLVDWLDNGNRGNSDDPATEQNELLESLSLYGIDGSDGLLVGEGSTLFLGESKDSIITTYAFLDGEMTNLLSLWDIYGVSTNRFDLDIFYGTTGQYGDLAKVPIPAALPLFASALFVIGLFSRRKQRTL